MAHYDSSIEAQTPTSGCADGFKQYVYVGYKRNAWNSAILKCVVLHSMRLFTKI